MKFSVNTFFHLVPNYILFALDQIVKILLMLASSSE